MKKVAGALALMCCASFQAQAAILEFASTLTTGQEVTAPILNGATPSGTAAMVLNTDTNAFAWVISFEGLSSNATLAHFHAAAPGVNGPVRVDIPSNSLFSGIGAVDGVFSGGLTLSDAQETELTSGLWYINIHTVTNPGGELRGQVLSGTFNPVPLPAAAWLMLPALGALGLRRRAG